MVRALLEGADMVIELADLESVTGGQAPSGCDAARNASEQAMRSADDFRQRQANAQGAREQFKYAVKAPFVLANVIGRSDAAKRACR